MERDQALKFMNDLLRLMLQKNGSDLFITVGFPPAIKVDGRMFNMGYDRVFPIEQAPAAAAADKVVLER